MACKKFYVAQTWNACIFKAVKVMTVNSFMVIAFFLKIKLIFCNFNTFNLHIICTYFQNNLKIF